MATGAGTDRWKLREQITASRVVGIKQTGAGLIIGALLEDARGKCPES